MVDYRSMPVFPNQPQPQLLFIRSMLEQVQDKCCATRLIGATPAEADACINMPAMGAEPTAAGAGTVPACRPGTFSHIFAKKPALRVYWVDPGDMRTQMQQEAFPNEDISDRPMLEESVPGLIALIEGNQPSGRYRAREVAESAGG
jgi:hypothetical protein